MSAVPLAIFLLLFGGLFLPRIGSAGAEDGLPLKVMTLNVLYTNDDGAGIEEIVRAESPDLICLQELNPRLAADLVGRLAADYPHYVLLPAESVIGQGVFSRYPLEDLGQIPGPGWRHAQMVTVTLDGRSVLVLNAHAWTTWLSFRSDYWGPAGFLESFRVREEQARLWLERVAEYDGPVILAGDFNCTDQNGSYRLLAGQLHDAYREAGWGLGHTFPAFSAEWEWLPVPSRLFRLDYVWHTAHWAVADVWVGDWDGQSDHLPVFADLLLLSE